MKAKQSQMELPINERLGVTFHAQLWNFNQCRATELARVVKFKVFYDESRTAQADFHPPNPRIQTGSGAKTILEQGLDQCIFQENQRHQKDDENDEQPYRPPDKKFHIILYQIKSVRSIAAFPNLSRHPRTPA